ncbi:MAG: DUF128 domain-containing protein [bacterium]
MRDVPPRLKIAMLRILRDAGEAIGSAVITQQLKSFGFDLSSRTIRLYLKQMEEDGLVGEAARGRDGGRVITPLGLDEIRDAQVVDRVGFTSTKIDALACQTTFNLALRTGLIVLNVSTLDEEHLPEALRLMFPVFQAGLGMGRYLALARAGERLGNFLVPPDQAAVGTVCSVTLNGVLLKHGIPVSSRFGGVLELQNRECARFTEVIDYAGSSLDPLEIFIKSGLTSVYQAALTGNGRIGASFREVPSAVAGTVQSIHRRMEQLGLGGIIRMGAPNQPLLDFPVPEGKTGFLVTGGMNPVAAVEEAGIRTRNMALCTLYQFEKLISVQELEQRYGKG